MMMLLANSSCEGSETVISEPSSVAVSLPTMLFTNKTVGGP